MSSELEEVRQRVAALTARVEANEGLRAMMDRDLADIKQRMDAQDLLLQALHVTQSNHTQRLTRIEDAIARMDATLSSVSATLSSVSSALGGVNAALARVDEDFRGKLDIIVVMLDRLMPPAEGS